MPLRYAVLAPLSRCYSPPRGRLPTCYSPGRHSTHPRRNFRVRLACVRHAASVDSEPGSNSQLFNPYPARASAFGFSTWLKRSSCQPSRAFYFRSFSDLNSPESLLLCSVFKDRLLLKICLKRQTLIISNPLPLSTSKSSGRELFFEGNSRTGLFGQVLCRADPANARTSAFLIF